MAFVPGQAALRGENSQVFGFILPGTAYMQTVHSYSRRTALPLNKDSRKFVTNLVGLTRPCLKSDTSDSGCFIFRAA